MEKMFNILNYVLPQLIPIIGLLFLTLYIFTLIALVSFPYIRNQTYLNGFDVSFTNFGQSLFSLFRVTTNELWFAILADTTKQQQPNFVCEEINSFDDFIQKGNMGCGTRLAYLFFVLFHILASIFIVNLLIAFIITLTNEAIQLEKIAVNRYQLIDIQQMWREFDPKGSGFINYKDFWKFSSKIAIIYGVKPDDLLDVRCKKNFLTSLKIPLYENKKTKLYGYIFHDVLIRLTKISMFLKYGVLNPHELETLKQSTSKNLIKTNFFSGDMACIIMMQHKFKSLIKRINAKININQPQTKVINNSNKIYNLKELCDNLKVYQNYIDNQGNINSDENINKALTDTNNLGK